MQLYIENTKQFISYCFVKQTNLLFQDHQFTLNITNNCFNSFFDKGKFMFIFKKDKIRKEGLKIFYNK